MNHLTNLYKHKCEQLQEQINNMKRMLNESVPTNPPGFLQPYIGPDGHHYVSPSPQTAPEYLPGYGPGIKPKPKPAPPPFRQPKGTPKPAPKGTKPPKCPYEPGSLGWEKWVRQAGHWHYNNPHPFGSPAWEQWEIHNTN